MSRDNETVTDFDLVWAAYPRKTNKAAGRKAFNKLSPDAETVQLMLDALVWQKQSLQWQKLVIPHLSTWINKRRWEDEAPVSIQRPPPTGEVVELAKSIARRNAEQLEQDRTELQQRVKQLIGQGMNQVDALFTAGREWIQKR